MQVDIKYNANLTYHDVFDRRIVTFLIIAPYKYSYLLTYKPQ